jgi:F-type H+-transporting ATPase subunit alpha
MEVREDDPIPDDLPLARQRRWLEDYRPRLRVSEKGRVLSVGDGVAWIHGLPSAAIDDLLEFHDGSRGLVIHLGRELVGAVLLRQSAQLTAGTAVALSRRRLSLPVGDALLGRVIDPLGTPLDGLPTPECAASQPLDVLSPPIVDRDFVREPLLTGNTIVDTMIPIGKGQRQLLIGDDGSGKTSLALDVVINQRGKGVQCVYVLIGQKRSTVVSTIETLRAAGAMAFATIVAAEATAQPGLKYLAPFAGCAVAERWMHHGRDTLVVYDDLTTHAQTYRELSLLLRHPPGREAYPADIFFLHARLLERATHLAASAGGGSMTALPIVQTKQGEIASYIPTNLISITDGQIYFNRELFVAGYLPAIDVTRSVSRIGGRAQNARIKREAGRMKLDYLQFLDLLVFTRFGTKLEPAMEYKIKRGTVLRELLKQDRLNPLPIEFHLAWLIAFNEGLFDAIPPADVPAWVRRLLDGLSRSDLGMDDDRARWVGAVTQWLRSSP